MKTAYIVDSTASLKEEYAQHPDVYVLNLLITFENGDEYVDTWEDDKIHRFYERLNQEEKLPTTSQPDPKQYLELFLDLIDKGYERVYMILLSKEISGTWQTASLVAQELEDRLEIHLINSRGTSLVLESMLVQLWELEAEGFEPEQILEELDWISRENHIYVMIDNYENLVKGGRASSLTAFFGKTLQIRPIIWFDEEGKLGVWEKVRTTRAVYKRWVKLIQEAKTTYPQGFDVAFAHANDPKKLAQVEDLMAKEFPDLEYRVEYLTPVLGVHGGQGAFGMGIIPKARI